MLDRINAFLDRYVLPWPIRFITFRFVILATISEIRSKKIAELQEKRAQEDHEHVTEMHELVLETLANQHQEIEELKRLLADIHGREYVRTAWPARPNLRELHPRGVQRFEETNSHRRVAQASGDNAAEPKPSG